MLSERTLTPFELWHRDVAERIVWRAARLLPRRIVEQAFIRVVAHATTGEYSRQVVPELTCLEALDRWRTRTVRYDGRRLP